MTSHPDAEALARFRESLLGRRRSARIRAHLAGCSRCASAEAGLAEVSALLASAPVPAMPGDLTARLEGVLAAEAATRQRGEVLAGADPAPGGPAGDADRGQGLIRRKLAWREPGGEAGPADAGQRARRWRPVLLGTAAVVTLLVVFGAFGLARLIHGGGTAASPGAVPALNAPAARPARSKPQAGAAGAAESLPVIHSGTDYQPGTLARQVQAVLASHPTAKMLPLASNAAPAEAFPPGTGQLQACVRRVTGGIQPSLIDLARYRGQAAIVIVAAPASGEPGQAWVTGRDCSAANPGLITHLTLGGTG